ncbi:MAG: tRNA epoxyqueuosine(34) reductase QueG [Anaerolineales bacterium]
MNELKQAIQEEARRLGFILVGVASSEPPEQYPLFQQWLANGYHADMRYLENEKRADPKLILPECKSILTLAFPYQPFHLPPSTFQIASYALGKDYHEVIPPKLKQIVEFIEEKIGRKIPNRYYTDTGPILERELAQRAGLGWVGKNSMLIHPKFGSTFFLAEILLGLELEPDDAPISDHCGTCARCLQACPTQCILPNRTIDARRCISYLTIENKGAIPLDLRPQMQNWVFGCDVCQQVCPWNRFSAPADSALAQPDAAIQPADLSLSPVEFNRRFKESPLKRAKRRGVLRNLAVALGNNGNKNHLPILEQALQDDEPLVREHAQWAVKQA